MFPQSELDNYKLQVELLQERLQRSEISRKQLEHKLEKILQKRDEHDKMVRSRAKQKYQQFLEEQQRRNERNKQLIQMLERIEQQTEVLNARSERLKMMKLQYEMYFAKQVHSQTRRCLQSSINPITLMMPTSFSQPTQPLLQQPAMEDHNYTANIESPATHMTNPYQTYATKTNFENEPFPREQVENRTPKTMEMPTLANFEKKERNDCMDLRNHNVASLMQPQQLHQQQAKYELINNNNLAKPTTISYNKQEIPDNIIYPTVNANNKSLSSATNLLSNDKQLAELNENSNSTATTSTIFEKIPNLDMMMSPKYNNLGELPITTTTMTKNYINATNNNNTSNINANFRTLQNTQIQNINEIPLKVANQKGLDSTNDLQNIQQNRNVIKSKPQDEVKDIKSPISQKANELKTYDEIMPKSLDKTLTSLEVEPSKEVIETSPNSSESTNYVNRLQSEPTEQIKNESLANNTELTSSITPVSIENIENKIYGELLAPLQTDSVQKAENLNAKPNILENLVTQPENIEIKKMPFQEPTLKQESDSKSISLEDSKEQEEQNTVRSNYEQTVAYDNYNNEQPSQELANSFADYENYKNIDSGVIDESQQQQQEEQYDYSNYDPTQYSYPGYIYDETTGEYKPDPNAPAEQYATDQQYSSEEYNQQYQPKDYDYNQTYTEEPTASSTTAEGTAYNNYDTTQPEISSNFTPADANAENQQRSIQPDPNDIQFDPTPEEVATTSSTKTTKPTSILSTADKNDSHKKKKRVNFIDSSETDESTAAEKISTNKPPTGNLAGSSESDFDFSSSTEAAAKTA